MPVTAPTAPSAPVPKRGVFRQQALNKLSAPSDQLDALLRVTSPRGWLALIALAAVVTATVVYGLFGAVPTTVSGQGLFLPPGGLISIDAPIAGTVTQMTGRAGAEVRAGDEIGTVSAAAGKPVVVRATFAGVITELLTDTGNFVSPGQSMAIMEPEGGSTGAVVFVTAGEGKAIAPGMRVRLSPSTAPSEQYGQIEGVVSSVSEFPVSPRRLQFVLQNADLVQSILKLGSVLEVTIDATPDPGTQSGLQWTSGEGAPFRVGNGTLTSASVILAEQSPAGKLFNPRE